MTTQYSDIIEAYAEIYEAHKAGCFVMTEGELEEIKRILGISFVPKRVSAVLKATGQEIVIKEVDIVKGME